VCPQSVERHSYVDARTANIGAEAAAFETFSAQAGAAATWNSSRHSTPDASRDVSRVATVFKSLLRSPPATFEATPMLKDCLQSSLHAIGRTALSANDFEEVRKWQKENALFMQ
jgi:hypothetical protein